MIKELTKKDIEAFDKLIITFENAFPDLEYLDGFLCAIACSPEKLEPSFFLPHIMTEDFDFPNEEVATKFMGYFFSYYNAVMKELSKPIEGPEDIYYPFCMSENEEGVIDGIFWANGFMHGLSICKDIWEPLLEDDKAIEIVTPMMIVASQAHGDEEAQAENIPEENREETLRLMFQNLNIAYAYLRGRIKEFDQDKNSPITPINQNQKIVH
jgi:uncharacterized protein